MGLSCEPFEYTGEFPKTVRPEAWVVGHCERGFVSLRFVAVGTSVYAIGVHVRDEKPDKVFAVGPMANLPDRMPEKEAAGEMLRKHPDWATFYGKLYKACGDSRPMALVCPGRDCPMTPEMPPPGLLGMTASYGSGSFSALEPIPGDRAYAARADVDGGQTATDALQTAPGVSLHLSEQEKARRAMISDTVARAVCAAKILTVPDPTPK